MRKHLLSLIIIAVLAALVLPAYADKITASPDDKLFGIDFTGNISQNVLAEYEKSGANAAFVNVSWAALEPKNNDKVGQFNISSPILKSKKTKIIKLDLQNKWADNLADTNPAEYQKKVKAFSAALAKSANNLGVNYFWFTGSSYTGDYAAALKAVYDGVKSVSKNNFVMAGPVSAVESDVQSFYDSGARGYFDVLVINAFSSDCNKGIDMAKVVGTYRIMAANEDEGKKLFVKGLWEETEPGKLRQYLENTYRNVLTDREIYDPEWVLGVAVDANEKAGQALIPGFAPSIPNFTFNVELDSGSPVPSFVYNTPYKLNLTFTNMTDREMKLDNIRVSWLENDVNVGVKADSLVPVSVLPQSDVSATFQVALPPSAAGRDITLVGELDYTTGGKMRHADAWNSVSVTAPYELNLLPSRLVLESTDKPSVVGMSVINHTSTAYKGKVTLTASKGLQVKPAEHEINIEPYNLDAFVVGVKPDPNAVPGHYAVYVDVGDGKVKDWIAVDIPLIVKKSENAIKIDGGLDDWAEAAAVNIAKTVDDGKYETVGTGKFAYDESNLYAVFEINDPKFMPAQNWSSFSDGDGIAVGFDPLINGARTDSGGYLDDDYVYGFSGINGGQAANFLAPKAASDAPVKDVAFAFKRQNGKDIYEMAFPLSEICSGKPEDNKDRMFAMSVLVFQKEDSGKSYAEWGGGMLNDKDPRLFIPVVLAK